MPRLVLVRSTPLTLAEAERLPKGARVDNGAHGGRVELELPARDLAALVQAAAALGRAVPDADLRAEGLPDLAAPAPVPALVPAAATASPPPSAPAGPWDLLERGLVEEALAAFARDGLDVAGREQVRVRFQSTDPEQVALACRIATAAQWRSFVTSMRRVLEHGDTRVRTQAVRAIGLLAGPAMIWQLERLRTDPCPEVRQAVADAVATIEGRKG